jgi:hypothetical protein
MPTPATPPRSLTVLVAPRAETEEILAVLTDYSAVGMVGAFAWVDSADVLPSSMPATMVRDGRSEPVALQQLLTGEHHDRIRVVVLVPIDTAAKRASLMAEQTVEQTVRSSSMGAGITLLRLLITRGVVDPVAPDPTLLLEGWHNLLVAPEDSAGPGLGATALNRLTDPLDVARQTAPVVAGVAGLWSGVERTPFDTLEILPGQTVRAVRAFYRWLDTTDVEESLRGHLFDPTGRLPLPHGGQVPVVYVDDVATATQSMARALWTKHRDVLRGPRLSVHDGPTQAISIWAALRMFLKFVGAALRRAPAAWLSAALGSVTSAVAATVQGTVFGHSDSAFAVVSSSELANWQDLARSAEAMSSALSGPAARSDHLARVDLSGLWTDFVSGALTLADGGRRAAGLEPIHVGASIGVLPRTPDVVPSAAERFAAIPASLAAVVGTGSVEGADVLGATNLAERLRQVYQDPASGVEARHASTELEKWQRFATRSYAWQVGAILADFLQRSRSEITDLVGQIQAAANRDAVDERLRNRQQAIGTILTTSSWTLFAVLVLLAGAAGFGWLSWTFALSCGGVLLALYLLVALTLFLLGQRDVFAEMNLRKSQMSQLETMNANLRSALADLSRLSGAYGQLLAWTRALGAVLRAPFGPAPAPVSKAGQLLDGLPRSTQLAVAAPKPDQAGPAEHRIARQLYALGWLTKPWEQMVVAAADRLREEPAALFKMPGAGTGSGLDQWSSAVGSGRVQAAGADALWARVEQMFTDGALGGSVGDTLTGTVFVPNLGREVAAAQFSAGMTDYRPEHAAPFLGSLFTDAAVTAGRAAVAVDEVAVARRGLGYRAVVVQASDGLPAYDFAMFAPASVGASSAEETTTLITEADADVPPGGDVVF